MDDGGVEDLGRICGKEKYNFIDIRVKSNYSIRGNAGLLEISRIQDAEQAELL